MNKQELHETLQNFGRALAENKLPLTFFIGGDVEFGRIDIINQTEPGLVLKKLLTKLTAETLNVNEEDVDEYFITYYLMMNTSVLIEHTSSSLATGVYQPSIDSGVFTLDEDEIKEMYKVHKQEVPDKALKDLQKAIAGVENSTMLNKFKAVRLDWSKCKTSNPRSLMSYDDGVHILPIDVIVGYVDKLKDMARTQILKIKYRRRNTAERLQYVTLNMDAINLVYREDLTFANEFHQWCTPTPQLRYHGVFASYDNLKGFWRVGDLGLSRFSHLATRLISLSRITSIELATQKDLNEMKKYVNVDLEAVLDIFIHYATQFTDEQKDGVMRDLGANEELIRFVQSQVTIFSTTYIKFLHDYMSTHQELFTGYTGVKTKRYEDAINIQRNEIKFGSTEEIDF